MALNPLFCPIFSNVMFYGLFVVLPLTLMILGLGFVWVWYWGKHSLAYGLECLGDDRHAFRALGYLFLGAFARLYLLALIFSYNVGVLLNEPMEDGPPPGTGEIFGSAILPSLLGALVFTRLLYAKRHKLEASVAGQTNVGRARLTTSLKGCLGCGALFFVLPTIAFLGDVLLLERYERLFSITSTLIALTIIVLICRFFSSAPSRLALAREMAGASWSAETCMKSYFPWLSLNIFLGYLAIFFFVNLVSGDYYRATAPGAISWPMIASILDLGLLKRMLSDAVALAFTLALISSPIICSYFYLKDLADVDKASLAESHDGADHV